MTDDRTTADDRTIPRPDPDAETDIEPAGPGTRTDQGASGGATPVGPAPGGDDPAEGAVDTASDVPGANVAPASGGYGSTSDRPSSAGTGDGETTAGQDPQTEWLRDNPADDPSEGS